MTATELQVLARSNKEQIHAALYNVRANFLVLGKLLKENHDLSLWKTEYDSWPAFLGDPEISMKEKWAYGLIQVYSLYVEKLGIPTDRLLRIEVTKLLKVAPVVESDPEEWLSKAEHLSVSDLIIERGGRAVKLSPPPPGPSLMTCINGCGPGEKSHFPVGRGGSAEEGWWLPMCRGCHTEYHQEPKEWCWKYRKNWAKYLYSLINRGE